MEIFLIELLERLDQHINALNTREYMMTIFSLAVFEENIKVLSKPCRRRRLCAKTLTFSNISIITEDIYLKLRLVVHY